MRHGGIAALHPHKSVHPERSGAYRACIMTGDPFLRITPAGEADLAQTASLFRQYAASLPVDLNAQGFEEEIARLPGPYAPPGGTLLLARQEDAVLGCIALKRL